MLDRGEIFAPAAASVRQLSLAASETPSAIPPDHQDVGVGLGKVLANNPGFSFRSSSLSAITDNATSFDGISEQTRPKVEEALRDLQKAQALAHIPEALPVLFQTKMSAFHVSQQPQDQFVANFGPHVGGAAAAERIHDHAVRVVARNDHALTVALQAARGSGLAAIDGPRRSRAITQVPEQINLEKLFGSLDYCECSDCSSVASPAAYYVELLQFLRNNNLNPSSPWKPWTDSPSYDWSPLDYLFRRRPDLACLELTCANSNTVLPYIDLANEVMESFIVHQKRFADSILVPKQSWIDIFNASDAAEGRGGSSAELLAVPQNVNKTAYEILDRAVYPAARLPYNQPLDSIRQFLVFLATSRAEVMKSFQTVYRPPLKTSVDDWAEEAVSRAIAAEELGISHEEYIILTKEAFWSKAHFDIRYGQELAPAVYQERIGVKNPWEYWGLDYASVDDMLDLDEDRQSGLAFVKKQLLPRTGVQYSDLVDAIKTRFMNPNMPQGRAKVVMERILFSYEYLLSLIIRLLEDPTSDEQTLSDLLKARLKPLTCCAMLYKHNRDRERHHNTLAAITSDVQQHDGLQLEGKKDKKHSKCRCGCDSELKKWVLCYFDQVGSIVVLDNGEGLKILFEGDIFNHIPEPQGPSLAVTTSRRALGLQPPGDYLLGHIHKDGRITESATSSTLIGHVALSGIVYLTDGSLFMSQHTGEQIIIKKTDPATDKFSDGLIDKDSKLILYEDGPDNVPLDSPWTTGYDDCDLTKVRLRRLSGKSATKHDYDKLHRFLRLWRKLGWTIGETDAAISAFGSGLPPSPSTPAQPQDPNNAEKDDDVDYSDFQPPCDCGKSTCRHCQGGNGCKCKPSKKPASAPKPDITAYLITQIAAIKKLADLTSLTILRLLSWWTTIDTFGPDSLYAKLFLTHNMLGLDPVFAPDQDGNYLVQSPPPKISEHRAILLAAFQLRPADLDAFIALAAITDDTLSLDNVTKIYRHSLLAKVLGVRSVDLGTVLATFKPMSPWLSAQSAVDFVELCTKVTTAGFEFKQLTYVFLDKDDDPLRPVGPTTTTANRLASSLYTDLKAIDAKYTPVSTLEDATDKAVESNAQVLFSTDAVAQILGFLNGTRVYTTNAPLMDGLIIPDALKTKLKYVPGDKPRVQSVGQLTEDDKLQAKRLAAAGSPSESKWVAAIDRLSKQAVTFLKNYLGGIFDNLTAAEGALTGGDEPSTDPADPSKGTAATKRLYFLASFIPFLKKQLSVQTAVAAMAGPASLPNDITATLLEEFLVIGGGAGPGQPATKALDAVLAIKDDQVSPDGWRGHLMVSSTQTYTFLANSTKDDDQPAAMLIDGQEYAFTNQQDDPTDVWVGGPIKLFGGKLYELVVSGQQATSLIWMTDSSEPTAIPSSSLIPSHASGGIKAVLSLLVKSSFIVNNFKLSLDEVRHFGHWGDADFAGFSWNKIELASWKRLNDYAILRDSLPKAAKPLLQLLKWATSPSPSPKAEDVPDQIHQVTLWEQSDISQLLPPSAFDLAKQTAAFRNEIALTKMQKSLSVARRVGITISNLFQWGHPLVRYSDAVAIAESIKTVTRSRYSLSDWEKAIKPTFDTLRQNQSDALSGYLTVQPMLVQQGIIDVDSLFEFFLIDPSMCPCMETSRLKQATSSVQLFIQRCLLGLEDQGAGFGRGVDLDMLDRHRWDWMQRYRLWEANRKVFLFPENWIQPSLRDDKTPQYKAFESELLQGDLTEQTAVDALKNYLFSLEGISNLQVFSVYPQQKVPKPASPGQETLDELAIVHFFARTPASPYKYFYRTLDCVYMTWTPWQQMQVDIPSYEIERSGSTANSSRNGCYIVPFMHDGRLVVGLPQFMKKQLPQTVPAQTFQAMAGDNTKPASDSLPLEYWEIKFGFTELRNGIWKQKTVTTDAVWEAAVASTLLPGLGDYQFVPELAAPPAGKVPLDTITHIHVLRGSTTKVGKFSFDGNRVYGNGAASKQGPGSSTFFQLQSGKAAPLPIYDGGSSPTYAYPTVQPSSTGAGVGQISYSGFFSEPFGHQFAHALVGSVTSSTNLDTFFERVRTVPASDEDLEEESWGVPVYVGSSLPEKDTYNELFRPYSTYNWEMGFHIPMALATKFLEMQQFDLALKMCHYVFDPYAKGSGVSRYWKFPPFQHVDATKTLQKLFQSLKAGTSVSTAHQINQWRDRPFEPHVLARLRPVAYMRWTVVKYIQILIAYGDWYFNQNTLELIPMAIQCYVLASHIYGPRGQKIPRRGKKQPETYLSLLNKWDAFGNAMVQLELDFPFSNQIGHQWGESNGVQGLANIFGFATNLYFCIPNNDQLAAVRDTIDDRLYKIRHCQDIKGVFRKLPLYEPPLDVGNLVAAAAQGLSLTEVLNDLNTTMPNFRFTWVLPKALELIAELKSLGGAFLTAKEKQDGEALSILRQKHDVSMQNLIMEQKKLALQEAEANLASLVQSRNRPQYQLEHTLKLLGEDASVIPQGLDDEWRALGDPIPAPQNESGLKLSPEEAEEMNKTRDSFVLSTAVSVIQTISSELHALPTINAHASPFGVGVAACWGPPNIAEAMNGIAAVMRLAADVLNHQASMTSRKNSHIRTRQERIQSANTQGLEIKNIDAQISTQRVRVSIANQEITNHQAQIEHAEEVLSFLTSKYTNTELYSFMEGRVRTLYYQLYQLAYAYARKAELVYHFERGDSNTQFINSGFWIPSRNGLLSGEALYLSLKQLEAAYHETTGWDYEISKFISLRQTSPLSLLALRETGTTTFALPEILFDMDFPGHYNRKMRSVSLTIPCVVGPYTTINATLRLTSHKIRTETTATSARDYLEKVDDGAGPDRRFKTSSVPHSAVAISSGNADSGVFDMAFGGERFLP
ncbi:hypothetical protein B0T24DRAFT_526498, partial [Lasiosphaeria ovina]